MSDGDFKGSFKAVGYSHEEFYFHKLNQELIEKMKKRGLTLIQGGLSSQGVKSDSNPSQDHPSDDSGHSRKNAA